MAPIHSRDPIKEGSLSPISTSDCCISLINSTDSLDLIIQNQTSKAVSPKELKNQIIGERTIIQN